MGVNSLPKTVTRQRRDWDLNPGPSAPESSTLTTRLPSHRSPRVRVTIGRCAFHGARGHLLPTIDHTLTERRVFRFVGLLVVQAARRGCRGVPGLCDAVRHFLAAGARISAVSRSLALVTLDDVADLDLRNILVKVTPAPVDQRPDLQNLLRFIIRLSYVYRKIDLR